MEVDSIYIASIIVAILFIILQNRLMKSTIKCWFMALLSVSTCVFSFLKTICLFAQFTFNELKRICFFSQNKEILIGIIKQK